ncbi:putative chitin synthase activator (Chs3) [Aspergillus homomorphus CBS 101889]|uniref:Chitin synthase activator n=1 Tax=Aspergillus homomorphus (strain CBS 101889) TaxID=1450537 RepID=A0A395IDA1_ASPHC|nr:chitin synthase activator [Aspergillus homomorphus CBS 101889]RAL16144.1 chitin synthase activator [Aspergillus homomorphus CBS 101889]
MAYQQRPVQRAPPVRNYGPPQPAPGGRGYPTPPQDGYLDDSFDSNYRGFPNGGHDHHGYGYHGGGAVPRSYGPPPRAAPRPSRGGYGRPMDDRGQAYRGGPPPQGHNGRRGSEDRIPVPRQERMRPPGRPPQPPQINTSFPSQYQRRPSLESGMAAMDLNGSSTVPTHVPDRPHTSHAKRPPRPMSPERSRGNTPGTPVRSASTGRPSPGSFERRNGPYTDPQEPPPIPHIDGSATIPVSSPTQSIPPNPLYPGQATYQDPSYSAPQGTHERFDTAAWVDSYYNRKHAEEPDMPNFDAMLDPTKGGIIDESLPGLEQPQVKPSPASPTSNRPQYAAFSPQSTHNPYTYPPPDPRGGPAPNQFVDAGFQFDLPADQGHPGAHYHEGANYAYSADPSEDPYMQRNDNWSPPGQTYPENPGGYAPADNFAHGSGQPQQYRAAHDHSPPTSQPDIPEDPQNPDALPHHPVPFRPGLEQATKPAPMRQYESANNSTSPPTVPQGPPTESAPPGPVTQGELQRLQQLVKAKPNDRKTQLLLAQKLVEASTVLVDASRMDPKTKAKAREKYIMDGYKIVKKLVSAGYADAQFYMADCYGQGQMGLQVDPKEAFGLYYAAAKQGHAQSAYRVAVCCEIGQEEGGGTKRDPFKAVQWYKRAAGLGDPPAMYKMGMILLKGLLGQARNPREGVTWLKRAAERADAENPHALHELALMYANGGNDVVARDEAYASQLFHQAAELGYKFSQFYLGNAYEYGLMGCPVDPRQSIIYYTYAAAQGEHQSELALSGWYLTGGEGILQQSDTEAYLWARKAATAGLAKAEYAMGYFTEVGIGVVANLDDAKRWYWRAAAQGFPKARERLEELKKGGARMQKTRLSRSAVNQQKQNEGDCVLM